MRKNDRYEYSEELLSSAQTLRESLVAYRRERQVGGCTLKDYYTLPQEQRAELIDGVLYDMAAPTTVHQQIITELSFQLKDYIRKNKGTCFVFAAPTDVQLDCDDKTMVQPDIMVVCRKDKILKRCIYGSPDMVIEVSSPATRRRDISLKLNKYADAGVREYWIVEPDKKKIVVYDLESEELPVLYGFEDRIPVKIFDQKCLIDFRQIYEEIEFLY